MGDLVKLIGGILTGGAGPAIGAAVSWAAQLTAVAAVVGPVLLWLSKNKDSIFISLSYGDLAFWGAMMGGMLFLVVRLVHRAPPPA